MDISLRFYGMLMIGIFLYLQMMKFRSSLRMSMAKMNRRHHNYKRAHELLSQEIQLVIDDVMEG